MSGRRVRQGRGWGVWCAVGVVLLAAACDQRIFRYLPDAGTPDAGLDGGDAGTPDAGADGGLVDAGAPDSGVGEPDAGPDGGPPDAGIPAVLGFVSPGFGYLREGQRSVTTFPQPLTVALVGAVNHDTYVGVGSSDVGSLRVLDGGVVIPEGQTSAVVLFDALAQASGVTVTASLNGATDSAVVRVLGTAEQGNLIALVPDAGFFSAGDMVPLTVVLDLPANGPVVIALAVVPDAGSGEVPATVTVPGDQWTQSFDFVTDAGVHLGAVVVAQQGSISKTATLVVRHLVISEIGPGTALTGNSAIDSADEFVELYNPTSAPIDLSSWKLQSKSAASATSPYREFAQLPGSVTIAPRGFYLIGLSSYSGDAGTTTPDVLLTPLSGLSIGAGGGALRIGPSSMTTDAGDPNVEDLVGWGTGPGLVYEGGGAAPTMQTANFNTIERKAFFSSTAASLSPGGSEVDAGNGWDTDRNNADFVLRPTRGPQNSASPPEP